MNFKKQLKKMKGTWKKSGDEYDAMFGASKLDEGEYTLKLQKAVIKEKNGTMFIAREHVVVDGEHEGVCIYDRVNMDNEKSLAFLRRWVEQLGYEIPEDPEDIVELLEEMVESEPIVLARVTQNDGGFTNISIIELMEEADEEESEEDSDEEESEDEDEDEDSEDGDADEEDSEEDEDSDEEESEESEDEDEDSEDELTGRMITFAYAWDLKGVKDDSSFDDVKQIIAANSYPEENLDEEELSLLDELGLEVCIERQKKKEKKKPAKTSKKSPAKSTKKAPAKDKKTAGKSKKSKKK